MKTYSSKNWEIDLPDNWTGELEEDIHVIYDPNGVGALQISAFIKPNGNIKDKELLEKTGLDEQNYHHLGKDNWGQFGGYQLIYSEGETFWRKFWLMNGNLFMFVTYNCGIPDKDIEIEVINTIVNTLRLN